ncbi:hypothetical protein MKW98_010585 [Papaver atlanticum]|uniref:Uncharacterized protein n=1 Tax=Papaver atlanticum TaxID=357466 RepID=A0AAD4S311_9MAGN|nr:hypothetical protein MKW98_010585 [Papaver atlanticum]
MQMICENEGIPRLVYVSRERRPTYHHRFEAGALNSLSLHRLMSFELQCKLQLRVSGIINNDPYILVLDCDMYCNDPTSAKQAMCFYFPHIFCNLSQNDIYDGQSRSAFKVCTFSIVLALIFFNSLTSDFNFFYR